MSEQPRTASWEIREADCIEAMAAMDEASVDAIVCDPPYGLEFMGKDWDRPWAIGAEQRVGFVGREDNLTLPAHRDGRNANCRRCGGRARGANRCQCAEPAWDRAPSQDMRDFQAWSEAWATEALRVLKPGGHLLAFGGTRTYHRLASGIEDAGFEIRDCIMWLYGSGFPKSLDVSKAIDKAAGAERPVVGFDASRWRDDSEHNLTHYNPGVSGRNIDYERKAQITAPATAEAKAWDGWGTALKPAHEPIIVARKPLAGTVAGNVLAHGTGALNVDGCRIAGDEDGSRNRPPSRLGSDTTYAQDEWTRNAIVQRRDTTGYGRWPANVVLDEEAAAMLDEQTGELHSQDPTTRKSRSTAVGVTEMGTGASVEYADRGGASRFFYCAKASASERNAGLDHLPTVGRTDDGYGSIQQPKLDRVAPRENWTPHEVRNAHPTVKPVELMRWLVRLVTPAGGLVLDPFAGSGTTGIAAMREGLSFVGIERQPEYVAIARERIRQDAPLLNTMAEVAA